MTSQRSVSLLRVPRTTSRLPKLSHDLDEAAKCFGRRCDDALGYLG
jgi:hypothetical protein